MTGVACIPSISGMEFHCVTPVTSELLTFVVRVFLVSYDLTGFYSVEMSKTIMIFLLDEDVM